MNEESNMMAATPPQEFGLAPEAADRLARRLSERDYDVSVAFGVPGYRTPEHEPGRRVVARPHGPVHGDELLKIVADAYAVGCAVSLTDEWFVFFKAKPVR